MQIKDYWKQGTIAAAVFAAAEEAMRNFGSYPWGDEKPVPPKSSSTKSASKSSSTSSAKTSASPTPYFLNSKEGTDPATFKNFVNDLDGGVGVLIAYSNLPWQTYTSNLTPAQAKKASSQSFMYIATPVTEDNNAEARLESLNMDRNEMEREWKIRDASKTQPKGIKRRAFDLLKRAQDYALGKASHLLLISAFKSTYGKSNDEFGEYAFDDSLGENQTIYVIDTGYIPEAPDFAHKAPGTIREYVVPNRLMLPYSDPSEYGPEDARDHADRRYHGTGVASVAAGAVHGVASKATLAIVKFRNVATNSASGNTIMRGVTEPALAAAWDWVINDVIFQRAKASNHGTALRGFIINMSYGFNIQMQRGHRDVLQQRVQWALGNDTVVVIAAGNDGLLDPPPGLHETSPQDQGASQNALITVGGTDRDGNLWKGTTPDLGNGGSITTYAQAYQVEVASGGLGYSHTVDGTSFAAPAVAGLAAYFFGIKSLANQWQTNSIPQNMKDYITSKHWQRQKDPIGNAVPDGGFHHPASGSVKVAWNALEEGLCNEKSQSKRLARRQIDGDRPIVSNGVTASNFAHACPATKSSSSPTSSPTPVKKQQVNAGYYKECGTESDCGPNDSGTIQLALWAHNTGTSYDPCSEDENPTYLDSSSTDNAKGPEYPITYAGPGSGGFSTATRQNCTLTLDEAGDSGVIECDFGAVSGTCKASTANQQDCDTGDIWQELTVCTI